MSLSSGWRKASLQVLGVKPFGEPAVDLSEELSRLIALALGLPRPAQACRCPQLQRFRWLVASHIEGLAKAGFLLWRVGDGACQQQLSFEPIQLRSPPVLPLGLDDRQGLC
jgi:hypothetical protein